VGEQRAITLFTPFVEVPPATHGADAAPPPSGLVVLPSRQRHDARMRSHLAIYDDQETYMRGIIDCLGRLP
jgi:hypothetical protein